MCHTCWLLVILWHTCRHTSVVPFRLKSTPDTWNRLTYQVINTSRNGKNMSLTEVLFAVDMTPDIASELSKVEPDANGNKIAYMTATEALGKLIETTRFYYWGDVCAQAEYVTCN